MMQTGRVVALMTIAMASCYAFGPDVVELTPSNFQSQVLDSDELWFVNLYAPWCGHCKNLAPQWSKAATDLRGKVKVGALDADAYKALADQYELSGFPTLLIFGADKTQPFSYDGGRDAASIVEGALEELKNMGQE